MKKNLKKLIIVPSFMLIPNRVDDCVILTCKAIADNCSFDLIAMDTIDLDIIKKYDIVFLWHYHYLRREHIDSFEALLDLPVKIISYGADMELPESETDYDINRFILLRRRLLLKSLFILCDAYEYFKITCKDIYDTIVDKMIWWPKSIVAYDRYFGLPFNEKPILKCTLAGKIDGRYPLRKKALNLCGKNIVYYSHPGYGEVDPKKYPIGDRFAVELNKYIAGICPSKHTGHVLEKHVIIPASGSLLMAETTPDIEKMGFISEVHYVPIDKDNLVEKVDNVISDPGKYRDIRLSGRKFIQENHTIKNRIDLLKTVLEKYE